MRSTTTTATTAILGAGLVLAGFGMGSASAASVEPAVVDGNPTCEQVLPGTKEYKLDFNPADGAYSDGVLTVTISNGGDAHLDWASDLDLAGVIMKGGPVANLYLYPGAADLADTDLVTPTNPNNELPYGTSHVSFCYDVDQPGEEPEEPGEEPDEPGDEPEQPEQPEQPGQPEVLSGGLERPAELPRTGTGTLVLAGAGLALTGVGEALRRLGRR